MASFASSLVLSGLASALSSGQKSEQQSSSIVNSGRTVTVRQPISYWRIIYGEVRVGGAISYKKVTNNKHDYHLVITFAGHVCHSIGDIMFNNEVVPLDANGEATGKYAGYVRIKKSLGSEAGQPFPDLVTESDGEWTDAHRQTGRTKIYVRIKGSNDLFPTGIPNISAVIKGCEVFDPRTGLTAWSDNPALCTNHYLTNTIFGVKAIYADEINEADLIASANTCDEAIPLAGGGTEKRYTCNGEFLVSEKPVDVIGKLTSSMAGYAVQIGSRWNILAGAYDIPTIELDERDLAGQIQWQGLVSKRDGCNSVKGIFVSSDNHWQPTDFPAVVSDAYITEDGGEPNYHDLELNFTNSGTMAQRLAKIELLRTRQGLTVKFPGMLSCYRAQPGRTIALTIAKYGWNAKPFFVSGGSFSINSDGTLGYTLALRETAAAIYDWATSEEQAVDIAPNTDLGDPFTVVAPTDISVVSENVTQPDGTTVPRLLASCVPPLDALVVGYEWAWREDAGPWDTEPSIVPRFTIPAIVTGRTYDVWVRAVNSLGKHSPWLQLDGTLADTPAIAPAAPTATATGAMFAVDIAWAFGDARTDIRGTEIWRASSNDRAGASRLVTEAWPVSAWRHQGLSPGDGGFYWLRVVDRFGNPSPWYPASATAGLYAAASADATDLLAQLQGALGEDQLAAEMMERIDLIDTSPVGNGSAGGLVQRAANHDALLRRLDQANEQAAVAALNAALKVAAVDRTVTDAGIVTDPDTGEVYIYGLREAEGRISAAEVRLNGAEATINLKASVDYVAEAIAAAVIDPSQVAELGDIYARLTAAEIDINGAEAAIALKATQVEVDGIDDRLLTAESEIDVLAGQIVLKAETSDVDAIDARLNTAEVTLNTMEGASIVQSLNSLRQLERAADTAAEAQLAGVLFAARNIAELTETIATAKNELYAHTNDGLEAEAGARLALAAQVDITAAALSVEQTARASADSAMASSVSTLSAQVNHASSGLPAAHAALQTEQTARASADSAIASSISTVQARLDSGDFAAVKTTAAATADALGNIEAEWGVQVETMADGTRAVGGIKLLAGTDGETVFAISANKLLIYKPDGTGTPRQIVTLGEIDGVIALGVDGNLIIDQSVLARHLSVESLSAITATIGTLRTADAGARMEISDNVIKVFDTSGAVRVKLGNLAL